MSPCAGTHWTAAVNPARRIVEVGSSVRQVRLRLGGICARSASTSVTGVKVGLDAAGLLAELADGAASLIGPDAAGRSKGRPMASTAPNSAAATMMAMPMISRRRGGA